MDEVGKRMRAPSDTASVQAVRLPSERLNELCYCITLDRAALCAAVDLELNDPDFCDKFIKTRPHLFSNAAVYLAETETSGMGRIVRAIESVARLPAYRDAALSLNPAISHHDHGPHGAFMGYDFHLTATGPKLIEVNTNAGGAFLNALLAGAQRACCSDSAIAIDRARDHDFESIVMRMFQREWLLQRGNQTLRRVAIVDDQPEEQYLYPEFILARRLFQKHGIEAVISDPRQLQYENGDLLFEGKSIDLVYNRLVDFSFDNPEHNALRAAYIDGAVVVTPNPHVHALRADKRNLAILSDQALLRSWGISDDILADLAGVPRTVLVTAENRQQLWGARKGLFFKPAGGHGGKAVYRGDKITTGVWAQIIQGGYVAQEFAAPSERMIKMDGLPAACKTDVRLYTYDGDILLMAARLYRGQTTNFRTPGGGFAPVFTI